MALLGLAWLQLRKFDDGNYLKLALLGAGQSIFLSPNSASALSRVSDNYLGITSGILATARNFGMVMGATLAAASFPGGIAFLVEGKRLGNIPCRIASVYSGSSSNFYS